MVIKCEGYGCLRSVWAGVPAKLLAGRYIISNPYRDLVVWGKKVLVLSEEEMFI